MGVFLLGLVIGASIGMVVASLFFAIEEQAKKGPNNDYDRS